MGEWGGWLGCHGRGRQKVKVNRLIFQSTTIFWGRMDSANDISHGKLCCTQGLLSMSSPRPFGSRVCWHRSNPIFSFSFILTFSLFCVSAFLYFERHCYYDNFLPQWCLFLRVHYYYAHEGMHDVMVHDGRCTMHDTLFYDS